MHTAKGKKMTTLIGHLNEVANHYSHKVGQQCLKKASTLKIESHSLEGTLGR